MTLVIIMQQTIIADMRSWHHVVSGSEETITVEVLQSAAEMAA